jgi:hypothetical protein
MSGRQRQLARLVDEQGVHAGRQACARPQPGRARGNVQLAVPQRLLQLFVAHRRGVLMPVRVVAFRPLADPGYPGFAPPRVLVHLVDEVVDDRVRGPGDADRAALGDELEDLLGRGVRLPGPRRRSPEEEAAGSTRSSSTRASAPSTRTR